MLIQEKILGGKLICIDIETNSGRIEKIRITGDFFLHPEDTILILERSLLGKRIEDDLKDIIDCVLITSKAQLIGASSEDIERLVKKAVK